MSAEEAQDRPLRIVHVNTHDEEGGAAKVARQLCQLQNRAGHTAHLLVGRRKTRARCVSALDAQPDADLELFCQEANLQYLHFQGSHGLLRHPLVRRADVVHLHNIHFDYFNPVSLSALSHAKPVLWTLHDMHALTGFCNHSFECEGWLSGCIDCGRQIIDRVRPSNAGTAKAPLGALGIQTCFAVKKAVYAASLLTVACPSQWLGDKAVRGLLGGQPVQVVPNGVDTRAFAPRDKAQARARLGLPQDAFIVGAAAVYGVFNHPLKGGAQVREALARIRRKIPGALFLNIGTSDVSQIEGVINLPFCRTEREMAWHYAAMDALLYAAVAETFCLVAAEALACGRPVVAFGAGPLPEVVRHGQDGLLAPPGDVGALAKAALRLAGDKALAATLGHSARAGAVERFDIARVAARYEGLARRAVAEHPARAATAQYFDLAALPLVVQTPAFFRAEKAKGGTAPKAYAKARKRLAGLSGLELARAFAQGTADPAAARLFAQALERSQDYRRVFALRGQKRWAEALLVLEGLLAGAPEDTRLLRTYGVTLGLSGRPDLGLAAFERCAKADPLVTDVELSVCDMYRLMGDADRAWETLDVMARRDPGARGLALRRALVLELRGETEAAADMYAREHFLHGDAEAGRRAKACGGLSARGQKSTQAGQSGRKSAGPHAA
jgi:glycosyltransferase involved in cell wall biosynthesis